jgi:hypothetical protein
MTESVAKLEAGTLPASRRALAHTKDMKMLELSQPIKDIVAKLGNFGVADPAIPKDVVEAILLAGVAERNLWINLKPMRASGLVAHRMKSPVDGHIMRVLDCEDKGKSWLRALDKAKGHILFLNRFPDLSFAPDEFRAYFAMAVDVDLPRVQFLTWLKSNKPRLTPAELGTLQETIAGIYSVNILRVAPITVALRRATDPKTEQFSLVHGGEAEALKPMIASPVSDRCLFDIAMMSAARAVLDGRTEVTDDDVRHVFVRAAIHRIAITEKAALAGFDITGFLAHTVARVTKLDRAQLETAADAEEVDLRKPVANMQARAMGLAKETTTRALDAALHKHLDNCDCGHDHGKLPAEGSIIENRSVIEKK